ncbi:zinc-finger protein [Thoreauomyces humboldtii]|nr:zinc-finger protein [Thoreauomyces humboldtii]
MDHQSYLFEQFDAPASTVPLATRSAQIPPEFLDFDMSMFDGISPEAAPNDAEFLRMMETTPFSPMDAVPGAGHHTMPSPPASDSAMISPEIPESFHIAAASASPSDALVSPWGSLPSEPNVMRTSRHRRVASIGPIGGAEDQNHRRSASFHVSASVSSPTSATSAEAPRSTFRPSHRRGQSLGHALGNGNAAAAPFLMHPPPPIPRQSTFPSAVVASPHDQTSASWLAPDSAAASMRIPPRASLPDISVPSNGPPPRPRAAHAGHRRGYSIGTIPSQPQGGMTQAPTHGDAGACSMDPTNPSFASRSAVRQLSLGHRRGASLGHAAFMNPASPSQQLSFNQDQLPFSSSARHQTFQQQQKPMPYSITTHHLSQYRGAIPSPRHSHVRSQSLSSNISFIDSPINSAQSDVDPAVLDNFTNLHLQNEASDHFQNLLNGGVNAQQIEAQELSMLNELNGEVFDFKLDDMSPERQPFDGRKNDPQEIALMQQQQQQQQHQMQQMKSFSGPPTQSLGAALAAELPMGCGLKDDEEDEDEDGSEGDDDDSGSEAVEHRCQWTDCDLLFGSVDDLVTHVSELHIGSGKASYTCLWKGCTREQRAFTKRHKIHNHLRIHTGERPFECPVADCGKKFSRQDGLNTHIKTHSNVKPYVCSFYNCGKAYYHSRSLRKHEKTHFVPAMMNMNFLQQAGLYSGPSPYGMQHQQTPDVALMEQMQTMQKMQQLRQHQQLNHNPQQFMDSGGMYHPLSAGPVATGGYAPDGMSGWQQQQSFGQVVGPPTYLG